MLGKKRGRGRPRRADEDSDRLQDSGAGDSVAVEENDAKDNPTGGGLIVDVEMREVYVDGDDNLGKHGQSRVKNGGILEEKLVENKCGLDSGTAECQKDVDLMGLNSNVEEEQAMPKRRCLKEKPKANTNTPLRRSARRAAIIGFPLDSSNGVIGSHSSDKLCAVKDDASVDKCDEKDSGGRVPELPPSSKNLNLQNLPVSDVFFVYSFLRSFSVFLFLSPFTLEAFVESLSCEFPNPLIDSVHFTILQVLKVHLEHLSEEGNQFASSCLRDLNWRLLDSKCWPVYLAEYLLGHSSSMKPCFKLAQPTILNQGYYKLSADIKLEILQCLCDDVVEIDLVRSEIRRRMLDTELDSDNDQNTPYQYRNKDFTPNDLESSPPLDTDGEAVDPNHDECCLCKMNGNLICCDGCPAAFHSRCIGVSRESLPEGDWYCPECLVGKVDQSVKPSNAFHGAELLGIDIHGCLFFGCCGYLLVSDYLGVNSYHYYNKGNLNSVIEALMASSCTLYTDIIIAIKKYWSIPNDSACSVYDGCGRKESNCDFSLVRTPLSHFKGDITFHKSNLKNCAPQGCMDSTSNKFNSLTKDSLSSFCNPNICPESFIENPQSTKTHIGGADSFIKSTIYAKEEGLPSEIDEEMKIWGRQVQSGPSGYINYYCFGHISSSIAAEITSKSLENINESSKNSVDDTTMSSQLNIISKNVMSFDWSVFQKLSLDAHKERCGWCFSCKSSDNQDCLLNISESKFLESPEYLPVGLCTMGNKKNHMNSVVHNCLVIEDNLQGFLSGPWEDPCYRKHWRKCILEATNIESMKKLLLTLESSVRRIMLSNEWLKLVDSELTVGSACHILTSLSHVSSKKSGGRKRAKKSATGGKKNSFDAGDSDIFWWRGGKISCQLFNWKRLPRSHTVKCGRQAGFKKMPGIYYADGSEVAKRKKYIAWRVAVETSKTAAQLIYHVKDFHSNIRWNGFKNTQVFSCLAKEYIKQVRPLKNVKVCKKCVEGKQVNYVLDFGKKKNIPDIITKQAIRYEETSSGRKHFWLKESIIPLGLLKAYELKRLEQKDNKLNGKDSYYKVEKCKITKRKRSDGFSYLFSKVRKVENRKCGQCKKDIPKRDSVICEFCGGYFHKEHFTLPKCATDIMYMCRLCENIRMPVKLKSEEKAKVSVNLKAKQKGVAFKLTDRQKANAASKLRSKKLKEKAAVKLKTNGLKKHGNKAKGAASANLKHLSSGEKIPAVKNKDTTKSKRHRKMQSDRKFKDMINIYWYRKIRTSSHHAYWLNGVLWTRKNDCKRGLDFRSTKVLMPLSQTNHPQINPACILCHEKYNPDLIYLSCEKCGVWVHGAAVGINIKSIKCINGFKCHKCLSKCPPVCLYLGGPSCQVEPHDKNNAGEAVIDDINLQKEDNKLVSGEYTEQDFLHSNCNLEEEQITEATAVDITDIYLNGDDKAVINEYVEQESQQTNCNVLHNKDSVDSGMMVEGDANLCFLDDNGNSTKNHYSAANAVSGTADFACLVDDTQLQSPKDLKQEFLKSYCGLVSLGDPADEASAANAVGGTADFVCLVDDTQLQSPKDLKQEFLKSHCGLVSLGDPADEASAANAVGGTADFVCLVDDTQLQSSKDLKQEFLQSHCGLVSLGDPADEASAANAVGGTTDFVCLVDDTQLQSPKDLKQEFLQSHCGLVSLGDPADEARGTENATMIQNNHGDHGDDFEQIATEIKCDSLAGANLGVGLCELQPTSEN